MSGRRAVRPRLLLLLIPVALLPLALALWLGREGKPSRSSRSPEPATQVSLNLKAGVGNSHLVACGVSHHYTDYLAGTSIRLDGAVFAPPRGSWKVKVKLKTCIAGMFQPAGDVSTKIRAGGNFKGAFEAPVPGLYFARASVNSNGRVVTRSYKQFFRVK